jgi:hypothetical protein
MVALPPDSASITVHMPVTEIGRAVLRQLADRLDLLATNHDARCDWLAARDLDEYATPAQTLEAVAASLREAVR